MEHKEILTDKHIAEDLRGTIKPLWQPLVLVVLMILFGRVFYRLLGASNPNVDIPPIQTIFEYTAVILYVGTIVALLVFEAVHLIRVLRATGKKHYEVVTDTLVTSEDSLDSFSSYDLNEHGHSYYLYFSNFGKYFVGNHYRQFYRWSKMYAMGVRGMMTYATPGDTYYIVTDNNKTILYVYNTKLFEYKPDAQ